MGTYIVPTLLESIVAKLIIKSTTHLTKEAEDCGYEIALQSAG